MTGDTPFIGDSLRGLDGVRAVTDFLTDAVYFLTDLGFSASVVSGKVGMLNPRLNVALTGEAGLTCFTTLFLSLTTAFSAAAALLPLSLLRGRPRDVSSGVGAMTLGSGTGYSFFGADLDLVALLLGAGAGAAFFGGDFDFFGFSVYFLGGALLERDYAFDLLLDLAGVFLAAYFTVLDLETDFFTEALAADGLTDALTAEGLAEVGFTTEALLATDFLADDFLTDYTLGGDLTGDFTSSNLAGVDFLLGDDFLLGEGVRLAGEGDFCGVFLPIDF